MYEKQKIIYLINKPVSGYLIKEKALYFTPLLLAHVYIYGNIGYYSSFSQKYLMSNGKNCRIIPKHLSSFFFFFRSLLSLTDYEILQMEGC